MSDERLAFMREYLEQNKPHTTLRDELERDEIDRHFEELRTWLRDHVPNESWPQGQRQAYNDRLTALAGWLAKSQRMLGKEWTP